MEKKQVIDAIIDREWEMFRVVNGEERVSCQNDRDGFRAMRGAQYDVWSQPACESYLADLTEAERQGRNLPREKYIRMMKDTEPAAYAVLSRDLPAVSEEKQALVDGIWEILLRQTERLREEYPLLALGGRPLHARDEGPGETSVETYQRGMPLIRYRTGDISRILPGPCPCGSVLPHMARVGDRHCEKKYQRVSPDDITGF